MATFMFKASERGGGGARSRPKGRKYALAPRSAARVTRSPVLGACDIDCDLVLDCLRLRRLRLRLSWHATVVTSWEL
eukprot:2171885-Pyramimonas_sp.AAC.1